MRLVTLTPELAAEGAGIYLRAYRLPPWEERLDVGQIESYLLRFAAGESRRAYVLMRGEEAVGIALCCFVPALEKDFVRVEDLCITPEWQRRGLGSRFLALLNEKASQQGADSMLLATMRGYPSHQFYLKNGFQELGESVLLYREFAG